MRVVAWTEVSVIWYGCSSSVDGVGSFVCVGCSLGGS